MEFYGLKPFFFMHYLWFCCVLVRNSSWLAAMRRLKLNSNYDLVQLIKQKFEMRFAKNKPPQNNNQ